MSRQMRRMGIGLALVAGLAGPVTAQPQPSAGAQAAATAAPDADRRTAQETREALSEVLRQYPPSVADVLRLSPSLTLDATYLAPYPALAAFLAAHPEIVGSPSFYFGVGRSGWDWDDRAPASRRARAVSEMVTDFAVFTGLMTLLGVVAWLIKSMFDHQRWKRAIKVQSDAHAKVLDRLTATDDVLAYSQTPAGRHFLESGAPLEAVGRDISAPVGRILWSVQMGMVIAVLGAGVFICAVRVGADAELEDLSPFLFMVGTVTLAVGIGFLLSALVSYLLSRRLGLIGAPGSSHA